MSRRKKGEENPIIECACGCGGKLKKYNKWGNSRRFIFNHRFGMINIEYIKKRFWSNIDKRLDAECWEWQKARHPKGYGMYEFKGMPTRWTHRIAWILTYGPIQKGLCVCHHCDNPPCCNPNHLFLGTPKDNSVDCATKGRKRQKLFESDIIEIRQLYAAGGITQSQIAEQFGIIKQTVSEIIAGEKWAWVKYLPSDGEKQLRTKISDNEVIAIREQYAAGGITQKEISCIYDVDPSVISRIVSMRRRKGVIA